MKEMKQGSNPHWGNCLNHRIKKIKVDRETADLWKPRCKENQRFLAAAVHTPDKDMCPMKGIVAGS